MTSELAKILILTTIAGGTIPLGAFLASIERIYPRWLEDEFRHSVIAFGGGVLLTAVSLVLVPDGTKHLAIIPAAIAVLAGGLIFCGLDIFLARRKGSAPQLVAMLADFLREAIAMGASFATRGATGTLLALLIALQNLPEGFNAYRELLKNTRLNSTRILVAFLLLVPLGPLAGLTGYYVLGGYRRLVAVIMLVAAGGILYLTFQDIAPQARLKNRFAPALGAVLGFLLGLVGQQLVSG